MPDGCTDLLPAALFALAFFALACVGADVCLWLAKKTQPPKGD